MLSSSLCCGYYLRVDSIYEQFKSLFTRFPWAYLERNVMIWVFMIRVVM